MNQEPDSQDRNLGSFELDRLIDRQYQKAEGIECLRELTDDLGPEIVTSVSRL